MTLLKLVWRQASMNTCFDKRSSAANFSNDTQATKIKIKIGVHGQKWFGYFSWGPDGRAELDVNHADSDILMQWLWPFAAICGLLGLDTRLLTKQFYIKWTLPVGN